MTSQLVLIALLDGIAYAALVFIVTRRTDTDIRRFARSEHCAW